MRALSHLEARATSVKASNQVRQEKSHEETEHQKEVDLMPWKKDFLPFEEALAIVVAKGFKKYREFETWKDRPGNIPGNPRLAYKEEWQGREYWIGTGPAKESSKPGTRVEFLPFAEARIVAQELVAKHKIRNQADWFKFAKTDDRPPNLPADPSAAYREKGWVSWPDWFGRKPTRVSGREHVRPFHEARTFARSLKFKSLAEWVKWADTDERPIDIPKSPENRYRDEGWIGWGDFLGIQNKWTHRGIIGFLESVKPVVQDLSEAELFLILNRTGMLGRDKRLRHAKLLRSLTKLRDEDDVEKVADEVTKAAEKRRTEEKATKTRNLDSEVSDEVLEEPDDSQLRDLKTLASLEVIDKVVDAHVTDDEAILDFMISSRVAVLWKKVIEETPGFSIAKIRSIQGGKYTQMTRDRFLQEYEQATALPIPEGFVFERNGQPQTLNLMQRLCAYRLLNEKRVGNWSGVGAGKTIAALYSAGVCSARFSLIVAANPTLDDWKRVINNTYPHATVLGRGDEIPASSFQPVFLVVNYESFQLRKGRTSAFIKKLTELPRVDLIVFDEIQNIRQRTPLRRTERRENVERLLQQLSCKNPDLRILGMSATPVVNNLHEGKKLLETILGQRLEGVSTKSTVGAAIGLHTQLQRYGIRYVPNYEEIDLNRLTDKLDGQELLPQLLNVSTRDVLSLERIMVELKIKHLEKWLGPKAIIYSHFVEGIVEPVREHVEKLGYTVAVQTGRSKSKEGLNRFKSGKADVLIGSATIGTGVDELQFVCNRLIFLSLPWSNAEYQQIVGRLHRQGSCFDRVDVYIPLVVLREERAGIWSWDDKRLRCIEYKQTLADAALDGAVPQGRLPTKMELQARSLKALEKWVENTKKGLPVPNNPS
ncbi:MAG: helicase-related protein [Planctomycetaceae bacterium]